jgi:hypothetical protein
MFEPTPDQENDKRSSAPGEDQAEENFAQISSSGVIEITVDSAHNDVVRKFLKKFAELPQASSAASPLARSM